MFMSSRGLPSWQTLQYKTGFKRSATASILPSHGQIRQTNPITPYIYQYFLSSHQELLLRGQPTSIQFIDLFFLHRYSLTVISYLQPPSCDSGSSRWFLDVVTTLRQALVTLLTTNLYWKRCRPGGHHHHGDKSLRMSSMTYREMK